MVEPVAADVAHGDPGFLRVFVRDLHHLLAALLVHLRDAQADGLPFRLRIEAEIGLADRLLDRRHHAAVPDRDGEEARLGTLTVATWDIGIIEP